MSRPLVPAAARDLGSTKGRPGRPAGDADALVDLVDRVLSALAEVPPVDQDLIPEDLLVGWSFTAAWLSEAMPTFAAITPEAVAKRLREQIAAPTAALVDAVGRFWVRWLLEALLWRALSALDDMAPASAPQRLLDLAEKWVPRTDPVVAGGLLGTVAVSAGTRAEPLLKRLAATAALPPHVRERVEAELRAVRSVR